MLFEFYGGPLDGDVQDWPDATYVVNVPVPRPLKFQMSELELPINMDPLLVLIYRRYVIVDSRGEHRHVFKLER